MSAPAPRGPAATSSPDGYVRACAVEGDMYCNHPEDCDAYGGDGQFCCPTPAPAQPEAAGDVVEAWREADGGLPDYEDPLREVFEAGCLYAEKLMAKSLGVLEYSPCEGTESFDGDLGGTLVAIVHGTWAKNEHGDPVDPRLAHPPQAKLDGMEEAAKVVLKNIANYQVGGHESYAEAYERLRTLASRALAQQEQS